MKKKYYNRSAMFAMMIPFGLAVAGSVMKSIICLILLIVSIFIIVAIFPCFRHRESLAICIMIALYGIPFNIRISYYCVKEVFQLNIIGEILYFIIFFFVLFSLEEIVLGIIARSIWRRQNRLRFDREK